MARHNNYSFTRHNLNGMTLNKHPHQTSIQNTSIAYTGTCKECGGECASTVDECMSCAMSAPRVATTEKLIEMTLLAADHLMSRLPTTEHHELINSLKDDLRRVPNAGHAQAVARWLLEIAEEANV